MYVRMIWALLWEQARRTAPLLGGAVVAGVVVTLGGRHFISDFLVADEIAGMGLIIALLGGAAVLLYSFASSGDLVSNLPPMTLRLPVPTPMIALTRVAFNMLAIGAMSVMLYSVQGKLLDLPLPTWLILGDALAVFALLQVVALLVGGMGDWSLPVLMVAFFFALGQLDTVTEDLAGLGWMPRKIGIAYVLGAFAFVMPLSWLIVHAQRRGTFAGISGVLPGRRAVRSREADASPFRSAFAAQCWYERHRLRTLLPTVTVAIGIGSIAFIVIPDYYHHVATYPYITREAHQTYAAYDAAYAAVIAFMMTAVIVGAIHWFLNYRMQFGARRGFLFIRPVDTRTLAAARFLAVGQVLTMTALGVLLFTTVSVAFQVRTPAEGDLQQLMDAWPTWKLFGAGVLLFMGTAAVAWSIFWIDAVAVVFMGVIVYLQFGHLASGGASSPETGTAGWIATALLGVAAITAAVYAVRRDLLPRRSLVLGLMLAVISTPGLYVFLHWEHFPSADAPELSPFIALLPAIGLLPLSTLPYTLHKARHR